MLTVKNRYREPFIGMFDGQEYVVVDTATLPDHVAQHLKRQSIIRDNPITGDNDYQLGIVENEDPLEPILELPAETFDRSDTDYPKSKVIPSGIRMGRPAPRTGTGEHSASSSKER